MIGDALDAGAQASWVTGDEVYGNDPALRADCRNAGSGTCWRCPARAGQTVGGYAAWSCRSVWVKPGYQRR